MPESTREKRQSWPPSLRVAGGSVTLGLVAAIVAGFFTVYTTARSEVRDEVVRHDSSAKSHEGIRYSLSNQEKRIQELEKLAVTMRRIEKWLDREEEQRRAEQTAQRERELRRRR